MDGADPVALEVLEGSDDVGREMEGLVVVLDEVLGGVVVPADVALWNERRRKNHGLDPDAENELLGEVVVPVEAAL